MYFEEVKFPEIEYQTRKYESKESFMDLEKLSLFISVWF